MATAAFQGMESQRAQAVTDQAPPYIGTCTAWDISGPVVARECPLLYRPPVRP